MGKADVNFLGARVFSGGQVVLLLCFAQAVPFLRLLLVTPDVIPFSQDENYNVGRGQSNENFVATIV